MSYEIFEKLCKEKNVKPGQVSKSTGIATATLTNWKKGNYTPKQDKLQKIADYFGVTLDYLVSGHDADYTVTPEEYMIISLYREAPEYKKQAILDLLGVTMDAVEVSKESAFTA